MLIMCWPRFFGEKSRRREGSLTVCAYTLVGKTKCTQKIGEELKELEGRKFNISVEMKKAKSKH